MIEKDKCGKHDFIAYEIRHNDLEVMIAPDALAALYQFNDQTILDHSPQVLGPQKVPDGAQD